MRPLEPFMYESCYGLLLFLSSIGEYMYLAVGLV